MATPHIKAEAGDIAEIVLMPGDPLRAKFIAEHYLKNVVMFNDVRNMLGYTGYYNGKKVSVMGSGMGIPSIGIYSYELFYFFNVQKIIKIGSCGALVEDLNLFDTILVDAAYSDSTYAYVQNGSTDKLIDPSLSLTNHIAEIAAQAGINLVRGNTYTTDVFDSYKVGFNYTQIKDSYKCMVAEMEAFALFHNAKVLNKEAACLLTVSDIISKNIGISSEDREKALVKMIELALNSI